MWELLNWYCMDTCLQPEPDPSLPWSAEMRLWLAVASLWLLVALTVPDAHARHRPRSRDGGTRRGKRKRDGHGKDHRAEVHLGVQSRRIQDMFSQEATAMTQLRQLRKKSPLH